MSETYVEQKIALEKKLADRPSISHLQSTNIIKEGGNLAAEKARLQREMTADVLNRAVGERPSMDDLVHDGIVDHTNVAPSLQAVAKKLERNMIADTLNQKLYSREDAEELRHSGVLRATDVAPRLRDAKIRLEHAITRDHVGHLLEARPTQEELYRTGLIPSGAHGGGAGSGLASRLQAVGRKLEHNMKVNRVGHLLEKRSDIGHLEHVNVLRDMRVAPSLQGAQRDLERNLAKSNLYHALKHRPTRAELQQKGVYVPVDGGDGDEDAYHQHVNGDDRYSASEHYQHHHPSASIPPPPPHRSSAASSSSNLPQYSSDIAAYQRRSKSFHLTRILLKFVASMAEVGELSLHQKGRLKDMIVDQRRCILSLADQFDAENDVHWFKNSLVALASSAQSSQ